MISILTVVLAVAVAALLLIVAGLTRALGLVERLNASLAIRCLRQGERIQTYRAETCRLAVALQQVTDERDQLHHRLVAAALTTDAAGEPPMPRWGLHTLRDIHLGGPADFDTPGEAR
ncbi:hypothetical protein ABT023_16375 [Micromonospora sp. NPDC002296]|uniref:hypothetical protein n=1 Tax=Micromonospora sp. NPDC002296 TaxID=3154271 RepID=UPI0033297CE8